jgi:hypothetical protein
MCNALLFLAGLRFRAEAAGLGWRHYAPQASRSAGCREELHTKLKIREGDQDQDSPGRPRSQVSVSGSADGSVRGYRRVMLSRR